jgi:hypothetical protein
MKLIRFSCGGSTPRFGVVIGDRALAFSTLQARSGITRPELGDSHAHLTGLPETERAARELAAWGVARLSDLLEDERPSLRDVSRDNLQSDQEERHHEVPAYLRRRAR